MGNEEMKRDEATQLLFIKEASDRPGAEYHNFLIIEGQDGKHRLEVSIETVAAEKRISIVLGSWENGVAQLHRFNDEMALALLMALGKAAQGFGLATSGSKNIQIELEPVRTGNPVIDALRNVRKGKGGDN